MELKDYLKSEGLTQAEFASRLKVTQGLIYQWCKGTTTITPERALQIDAATDGVVSKHDLRPDIFGGSSTKEQAA